MSVYWIRQDGVRVGIMPRPHGNDWLPGDLQLLRRAGVDVIVSALTATESEELGLGTEAQEYAKNDLTFISFPIEDRSLPTNEAEFDLLIDQLLQYSKKGTAVVAHCRAGIGRSS